MNLEPLKDRVLVKKIEQEQITASGIILVQKDEEKEFYTGLVVAVGNGKIGDNGKRIPLDTKEGDKILFKPQNALEFPWEGVNYFLMRDHEVAFIIN